MDPFTQRMLERAKIRREKLDSHFSQKVDSEQRPPLQENSNVSIINKPVKKIDDSEGAVDNKVEKPSIANIRKNKLKKLAQFYSGNNENLLLENDENFSCENEKIETHDSDNSNQERKRQCKLSRLNELANKIKQWEDDSVHPKHHTEAAINKAESTEETAKRMKPNENATIWDSSMVEKLRSQGFSLSANNSRLIYDFQKNKENVKESANADKIPKKVSAPCSNSPKSKKITPKNGNGADSGSTSAVLKKAALFEAGNKEESNARVKDPAELSLAERKALFERNKGEVIMPATCFGAPFTNAGKSVSANRFNFPKPMPCEKIDNKANEKRELNLTPTKLIHQERHDMIEEKPKNSVVREEPLTIRQIAKSPSLKESLDNQATRESSEIPKPPPLPTCNDSGVSSERLKDEDDFEANVSKGGRLYPSLSNLDMTDDSERTSSEICSPNESKDSNFCLNMTLKDLLEMSKNNPTTPPSDQSFSKSKECQVLNSMDKLLESALNDLSSGNEGDSDDGGVPSPPKMMKSSSFEYKGNDTSNSLLHTVSFYRKQQQNSCLATESTSPKAEDNCREIEDESILVQNKIQMLLTEVSKQQTIISQASQALNLCLSTVEFSGSGEQVEGERLLLLASHKRQACLNEIQRLKVENSLRPQGENNFLTERGDVNLTNISIKLKRDALRSMAAAENLQYFVCLVKSDERVLATPVVSASRENVKDLAVEFPGQIKLKGLFSNFKVTVEVYNLELSKELLPHDIKYHINKKEKKLLTPIKSKKSESKLIKPHIQSPAGPTAVRTSNFRMCGYVVFSLREVTRTQWILNKVPYISPLEGTISMKIQSELRLDDEFRGFLTMFDDISGFGAWHRRWCLLSSHVISFWKYPDDEQKKVPIGTIDLRSVVTENVGLVSRDICARLHTFLLETTRPRLSEDKNSLVLNVQGDVTTIRHLLSADSKPEMLTWCKKINTILALLRSWKCNVDA